MAYVRQVLRNHGPHHTSLRVLEVGSRDVNGTPRECFPQPVEYLGVDLEEGPGVDQVGDIESSHFVDRLGLEEWDVVVSTEMLEHTPRPWEAVSNMGRLLRPGGRLILTTRAPGFGIHNYPSDFYRFTPAALVVLCQDAGLVGIHTQDDPDRGSPGAFVTAEAPR